MKTPTQDIYPTDDDLAWTPPKPSLSSRAISRRSRMSARVTIVTPDGRQVHAESHTEALAYYALQQHPDVEAVFEQPDGVRYVDREGVERFHTFDFVAVLGNGTKVAVIVKPRALAERRDTAGLARLIASQIPRSVADKVVLLTEEHVGGDRAHDARLLHSTRLFPAPEDDRLVMEHAMRANGPVSVASLCSATGLDGRAYRSVARLVGEGRLRRADGGRLTLESLVTTVGEGA